MQDGSGAKSRLIDGYEGMQREILLTRRERA